jgi:hypothetical protein
MFFLENPELKTYCFSGKPLGRVYHQKTFLVFQNLFGFFTLSEKTFMGFLENL